MLWRAILAIIGSLVISTLALGQDRIHVDGNRVDAGGPGDTWQSAFKYLQDALAAAGFPATEVQIWVAATEADNPYRPDREAANPGGTGDPETTFKLINNVRLYGGFAGDESALNDRNPLNNITVLSGDDVSTLDYELDPAAFTNSRDDNSYHVVSAPDGVDDTALIDGFWIVHGGTSDVTADESDRRGGAMLIESARPRVLRCVFTENTAAPPPDEPGGALFVQGATK